jgi:hypothetical protein
MATITEVPMDDRHPVTTMIIVDGAIRRGTHIRSASSFTVCMPPRSLEQHVAAFEVTGSRNRVWAPRPSHE